MTGRILLLCSVACSWAAAQTPCIPVTGAQILGADLARAVPAFHAIRADLPIAPSPLAGARRIFPVSELESLAVRFGVHDNSFSEVCFSIATGPLDPARLIEPMKAALPIPGVRIEVLETSTNSAPLGRIEFRREDLGTPAARDRDLPVIWRGEVIYGGDRRFSIWARVRVTAPVKRLTAIESLRTGVPVKAGQVREELVDAFPLVSGREISLSGIEGMVPLRSIAAGTEIRPGDLAEPNAVNRGDLVHVEVRLGAAHLALTARAESGGRVGDWVPVRNLESKRIFQARVDGPGSVAVQLAGSEETFHPQNLIQESRK